MARPFDLLFTDLDGTLLEEQSYAFEPAAPAIQRLKALRIPIVFCTSKTLAETVAVQNRTGIADPMIVENGGAIYFRPGQLHSDGLPIQRCGTWHRYSLGVPYAKLIHNLSRMRDQTGCRLRGFADMDIEEIAAACGLTSEEASLAKDRQYDEPFQVEDATPELLANLEKLAHDRGLKISRGGRFHHLTGPNDKGQAARVLRSAFQKSGSSLRCLGIGDSPNDLPMLVAMDVPVIVQRPGGGWDPLLLDRLPHALRAAGIGPAGWNQSVLDLLSDGS